MVNEQLGVDMKLNNNDISIDAQNNFELIDSTDNLRQAIFSMLATKFNEMNLHINYGSNLYEVIGKPEINTTLTHAKLVTREALMKIARIDEIIDIDPQFDPINEKTLLINISVKPIKQQEYLNLVYPLFL